MVANSHIEYGRWRSFGGNVFHHSMILIGSGLDFSAVVAASAALWISVSLRNLAMYADTATAFLVDLAGGG